jgi:hypothetical protein
MGSGGRQEERRLDCGIEFEVIWGDHDLVEFSIRCSNGRFSGQAKVYLSHDDLSKTAEGLTGFPAHARDARDFDLGWSNSNLSGVHLHFHCLDSVGHAALEVKLRSDNREGSRKAESVELHVPIEAAAVDSFVTQVNAMDKEQIGATACLRMAGQ